jgi:VWFA-related protein
MGASLAALAAGPQTASEDPPFGKALIRRGPAPQGESNPLLLFNLVVFDAKGEPYPGLRAVDIDIRDDGQPMQAVFCRPLESPEPISAPLGPNQYTNRPGSGSQSTLVLLDLLNADSAERGLGWREVLEILRRVESGQRLYLYLLAQDGMLSPVRGLPDGEHEDAPDDGAWAAQAETLVDRAMQAVDRTRPPELQNDLNARVQATLSALRILASDFAPQPGRKCLLWISHGVPIGARGPDLRWHDYTLSVVRLGTDLARAGIAVYAVDQQADRPNPGFSSIDTLERLAGLTAGQWFPGGAVEEAMRQAMSDGRATYRVGYRPPPERWDNKFHNLYVATEGKGGVRLQLRTIDGYYGNPREADPRESFALAAAGPSDATAIGIRAAVAPSRKGMGWMHFDIRVDAADLYLTQGATYTGGFSVTFAYFAGGWQTGFTEEIPTDLRLTAQERDAARRDGVALSVDRPVRAGATKMRIVVRDSLSGAVGSLTVPAAAPSGQ